MHPTTEEGKKQKQKPKPKQKQKQKRILLLLLLLLFLSGHRMSFFSPCDFISLFLSRLSHGLGGAIFDFRFHPGDTVFGRVPMACCFSIVPPLLLLLLSPTQDGVAIGRCIATRTILKAVREMLLVQASIVFDSTTSPVTDLARTRPRTDHHRLARLRIRLL